MKISELSYRDYLAFEIIPHLAGRNHPASAAKEAYTIADAMLKEAGKRDHEMEELRERAATAERTLKILRPTGDGETFIRIALDQIWLLLSVNNQTAAMQKLTGVWAAMEKFCNRVEAGEVRSRRTYAEFCELLGREPKQ